MANKKITRAIQVQGGQAIFRRRGSDYMAGLQKKAVAARLAKKSGISPTNGETNK